MVSDTIECPERTHSFIQFGILESLTHANQNPNMTSIPESWNDSPGSRETECPTEPTKSEVLNGSVQNSETDTVFSADSICLGYILVPKCCTQISPYTNGAYHSMNMKIPKPLHGSLPVHHTLHITYLLCHQIYTHQGDDDVQQH